MSVAWRKTIATFPNCSRCGAAALSSYARFCGKCGTRLALEQVYRQPVTGWKSIPAPIRFAIWIVAVPVLVGFMLWALFFLAVLTSH
jgi:hypothetical protein